MSQFDWSSILKPTGIALESQRLLTFEKDLGFKLPDDYKAFLEETNGGKVLVDHEIEIPQLDSISYVNCLWPLTKEQPSMGIIEGREIQVAHRQGLRQAIGIGDDCGTGFFFLILDGDDTGAVYFSFKDDLPWIEGDWFSTAVRIPD